jgi:hypothetical protein
MSQHTITLYTSDGQAETYSDVKSYVVKDSVLWITPNDAEAFTKGLSVATTLPFRLVKS